MSSNHSVASIEVERLVKTYRGKRGQPDKDAVRGIDLQVAPGEIFGFLGPNGAGKTTTVRMLCTLLPITSGTARIAGVDVRAHSADVRRRLGVALQEAGLDPLQTGRELLVLHAGLHQVHRPAERAEELLSLVGLSDAADRTVKEYSGGMKRRLDLATALVHRPDVLFLDEPTTGLDPASRATVWEEVRRINGEGTTVFLTTQYLEEADQLAARVAIVNDGLIVREGTPAELKAALGADVVTAGVPREQQEAARRALEGLAGLDHTAFEDSGLIVYVTDGAAAITDIVRRLSSAGITPASIQLARPSLDDVFLDATGHRLEGGEGGREPRTDQVPETEPEAARR